MYSVSGVNIAEAWCNPNYYWIYQGTGTGPIGAAYSAATNTPTGGFCYFNVTIGNTLRTQIVVPEPPPPTPTTPYPPPSTTTPYSFHVNAFANNVISAINAGMPVPVGWQLAIRDPAGNLVYNGAFGSETGNSGLPATPMTTDRRFDVASMSKTITGTAIMAALEDLSEHQPQLGLTRMALR